MSKWDALIDKLIAEDRTVDAPLTREFLLDTLDLAQRYATVEKLVLGNVRVAYSSSSLSMDLALDGDVVKQGEHLADAERQRLELPPGPILELDLLIEEQGIKVLARVFPAGSTALGGFFFDAELGPVILVNAAATRSDRQYTLARQYGHFLADFDPYITIVSGRPEGSEVHDRVDMRSHQFALAFLLPRADLEMYRSAMQLDDGSINAEFVHQLQVYFDVDPELVLWRLLSLGWLDASSLRALLDREPQLAASLRSAPPALGRDTLVPERFIRLVAHAFGNASLDLEEAGKALGMDDEETRYVLGQFQYPDAQTSRKPPADSTN